MSIIAPQPIIINHHTQSIIINDQTPNNRYQSSHPTNYLQSLSIITPQPIFINHHTPTNHHQSSNPNQTLSIITPQQIIIYHHTPTNHYLSSHHNQSLPPIQYLSMQFHHSKNGITKLNPARATIKHTSVWLASLSTQTPQFNPYNKHRQCPSYKPTVDTCPTEISGADTLDLIAVPDLPLT